MTINRETLKSMFERKRGLFNSVGAVVSMQQNPARFWPCWDQRVSVSSTDSAAQSQGQAGAAAVADPPPTKLCHTAAVDMYSNAAITASKTQSTTFLRRWTQSFYQGRLSGQGVQEPV